MSARDGFEGVGVLVELLVAAFATAAVFPLVTSYLRLVGKDESPATHSIWPSVAAYCASLLLACFCAPLLLSDQILKAAIFVWAGWLAALFAMMLAFRGHGRGRKMAIAESVYLVAAWFPFLLGRGFRL
jgi:hypothetical protein